jgi:hypothetical protein
MAAGVEEAEVTAGGADLGSCVMARGGVCSEQRRDVYDRKALG